MCVCLNVVPSLIAIYIASACVRSSQKFKIFIFIASGNFYCVCSKFRERENTGLTAVGLRDGTGLMDLNILATAAFAGFGGAFRPVRSRIKSHTRLFPTPW